MPQLYNKRSGQPERLLDEQVVEALSSGDYNLLPEYATQDGRRIRVISPDGKYGTIPAEKLATYLPLGFRLANDADKFATTGPGVAATAGIGALGGATLGASNWMIANLGGADAVEALRKANPGAHMTAELTTALGTALLGNLGALGVGAKAGKAGLDVAKAAEVAGAAGSVAEGAGLVKNTLKAVDASKGWLGGLTGAVSYQTQKLVDPFAKLLVTELTSKHKLGLVTASVLRGASLAPGAAIEGGIWGVNQALTERALGDPREVGEMFTDVVWPNIGWSAATAGALGTAGALIGGGVSRLAKKVATKLGQSQELLVSSAEHAAARHFGWSDTQIRDVREAVGAGYDTLFDESLLPDGSIFSKRDAAGKMITVTAKEAAERAKLVHSVAGQSIGAAYAKADEIAQTKAPLEMINELSEFFDEAMSTARRAKKHSPEQIIALKRANELRTMLDDVAENGPWPSVKRIVKRLQAEMDAIPEVADGRLKRKHYRELIQKLGDTFVLPFSGEAQYTMQKLKGVYDSEAVFGETATEAVKSKIYRRIWGILQDETLNTAKRTLGDADAAILMRSNKVYSELGPVNKAIAQAAKADPNTVQLEQLVKRWGYMNQWAAASAARRMLSGAGAAGGWFMGGLPGAVIGGAAGLGASYAASKLAPRAITIGIVANKAARLQTLAERVAVFDGRIQGAIKKWLTAAPLAKRGGTIIGAGVLRDVGKDKDPRKALKKLRQRMSALQDPEAMGHYLEESLGALRTIAPESALHSAATINRGVAEIQRILAPELMMRQPSLQPHLKLEPDVSDGRLEEIGLRVGAVTKPFDTIEEILDGTATQPQIESFVRVYPQLWAYVMRMAATELAARKEPLDHRQKMVLAKLGFRDWETPPWLQQQAAAVYKMQPAMGQMPQSGPVMTKLSRLNQAFEGHQGKALGEGLA